jgi:hypothetical protein
MRYGNFMVLASVALFGGCSDSTGPDGNGAGRTETFEWSGAIAATGTIEIRNLNGDVRARPGSGSTVRVRAVRRGRHDDPARVRIEVVETAQGVTICAVYPDVPGQPANECLPGRAGQLSARDNDVSVTFDVDVPAGRAFSGSTVAGSIEATDLSGYIHARTIVGDIRVSTSDLADATAINGDITASIGRIDWDRDLAFAAVAGDVTVRVPAYTNADVRGSTGNGSVSTDFPLSITRLGDWQQLRGRLGNGGHSLSITTSSGNIALRVN